MSRFLALSAATASIAVAFACSQQTSNAQEEAPTPPESGETVPAETPPEMPEGDGQQSIPSMMRATGELLGDDGNAIGDINLVEGPNGVLIEVTIEDGSLTEGWHAIHLHQTGDCSDTGEYKASGGHIGKIEGGHGLLNTEGPEPGDLTNLYVASDGSAHYETFTNYVSMSDILDDDGSAAIIHEGRDDHMSQPIGGAGGRVACAVIE